MFFRDLPLLQSPSDGPPPEPRLRWQAISSYDQQHISIAERLLTYLLLSISLFQVYHLFHYLLSVTLARTNNHGDPALELHCLTSHRQQKRPGCNVCHPATPPHILRTVLTSCLSQHSEEPRRCCHHSLNPHTTCQGQEGRLQGYRSRLSDLRNAQSCAGEVKDRSQCHRGCLSRQRTLIKND